MNYLAITEPTATWLLTRTPVVDEICRLAIDSDASKSLSSREFVEGAVRLSASVNGDVIAVWNVDYSSGSGDDSWGFIDLGALGGMPSILRDVVQRSLYVVSNRLQGLLIDGAFIHRSHPNGAHTCLSGRGTEARQASIGYVEREARLGGLSIRALIVSGPDKDLPRLTGEVKRLSLSLDGLVSAARKLYDPARQKEVLPATELAPLREILQGYFGTTKPASEYGQVSVPTSRSIPARSANLTSGWTFEQWMASNSPLSPIQRSLLSSDAIYKHPIRIIGPGGSGKTLLMQLLTLRCVSEAALADRVIRVLYLAHNSKMAATVRTRFEILMGNSESLSGNAIDNVDILTLSEYGQKQLSLEDSQIIDSDAYEAKAFQLEVLKEALVHVIEDRKKEVTESRLFKEVQYNTVLMTVLVRLLMSEISLAIKGHGLMRDENRYVQSERPLSRLHGFLEQSERKLVYETFTRYHKRMFDEYRVLDSDDVALSLLGKLRTPVWEMKRRELGYDHVFIDEMQLFNENERRIFPLLGKATVPFVPVVFALDEAQDIYGQVSSGLASLGIENVVNESLASIHRSSKDIVRLAFFVIQRTTDLFGPDFPDFTKTATSSEEVDAARCRKPRIEKQIDSKQDIGKFVQRRISALRGENMQRVAVICMAEQYWVAILQSLRQAKLPLQVIEHRGQKLGSTDGVVVLSRPAHIGGQEFDAIIVVGAENGLAPPRVVDNDALAAAVEQQLLRELYLVITRARYQIVFALSAGATPTSALSDAVQAGLIEE